MQNDPLVEWQRLTETYSTMYDDELLQLAADSDDLTEQARQVLSDEMRKRGLDLSRAAGAPRYTTDPRIERAGVAFGVLASAPELSRDTPEGTEESEGPRDYTWKTPLCGCEDQEEAWQISEVLRQAGIESWIERPGARHAVVWDENMVGNLQVQVAADQLDQARAIIANPIPKDIVEQSKIQTPEFEAPVCPKCGAEDPVLEGVDPFNSWLCEACGNEWTESAEDLKDAPGKAEI
jgi:ribosomal protein L37AE/L43A